MLYLDLMTIFWSLSLFLGRSYSVRWPARFIPIFHTRPHYRQALCMIRACLRYPEGLPLSHRVFWIVLRAHAEANVASDNYTTRRIGCSAHLWEYSSQARPVKPETVRSYLSSLKLYHIDCHLSLEAFNTPCISLIIKGRKRVFPKQKATRLLITKKILKDIIKHDPIDLDKLNIDTVFKVAWVWFLRLGEITYTVTELNKALFARTKVINSDISFAEGNQ